MAPDESTWDDTGFDPENENDGFLSSGQQPRKRVSAEAPPPPPPPAPPEKKKGRGALFWVGTAALGVLLVAVIGGGVYYLSQPTAEEEAFVASDSEPNIEDVAVNQAIEETAAAGTDEADPNTEMDAASDVEHDKEALDLLFGEESSTSAAQTPKPEPAATKTVAKPTPKPAVKKTEPVPTKSVAKAPAKKEPVKKAAPKTATTKPATKATAANIKTTAAPKGGALYVIQVYSSPSRDDADERLQLLRMKNVTDGYITEQQIKGESWYRVRFGQFTTRKEAEAEAIRLGLREPWIARIR